MSGYLAVVLDAYSRLAIGWAIERTLEAKLAVGALQMALDNRGAPAGLRGRLNTRVRILDCLPTPETRPTELRSRWRREETGTERTGSRRFTRGNSALNR